MGAPFLDVWMCTTTRHEPWRIALTVAICLSGALLSLSLHGKALAAPRATAGLWTAVAGAAAGTAVWLTHFSATIGFRNVGDVGRYDPAATLGSLLVGMAGFWLVFAASRYAPRLRLLWGALVGPIVAGLHYLGVSAIDVAAVAVMRPEFVIGSVVAGTLGGAASLAAFADGRSHLRLAAAAGLLSLGVAGLHFTGMTALVIPDAFDVPFRPGMLPPVALLWGMLAVAALVLLSIGAAVWASSRVHRSASQALEAALGSMPAGVAVYDRGDRLVSWNSEYERHAGSAHALAVGRRFADVLQAEIEAGAHADVSAGSPAAATWIAARVGTRRHGRDEEQLMDGRWLRIQDRRTADGGVVSIVTDVTELKQSVIELELARDQAEAGSRAKSEFLANMSHELRTPLNGVLGLASVIASAPIDPVYREAAEVIESSARTLEGLLSDLLDLARVEAGRLDLQPRAVSLVRLVRDTAAPHQAAAEAKDLMLRWSVEPNVPAEAMLDPLRVTQVLGNLLGNAVKFTPVGTVRLELAVEGSDLVFNVRDTGIGFDSAKADALFGRFEQGDGSITRRFGGAGLGLAISRELAEAMGGGLSACSTVGRGSVFTLRLPCEAVPEQALAA